ncbi:MAG: mechanosensitive ion channel [Peptostreptococcaceae bacterium]|nr:mechanosensitive ion channel [Peptostreptococcaceae bacterium]
MSYETLTAIRIYLGALGMKILGALVVWFVGAFVIKLIMGLIVKALEKSKADETLFKFTKSFIRMAFKVILVVTVVTILGVPMTSFIAILGAAGLAIGLALQGSLSNFAGGVLILVFRPFNVGDYIDAVGYNGTVREIQILYTILVTPENKTIIIPNGSLSNNSVVNYSLNETRRVDITFGVGFGSDITEVKKVIGEVVEAHDLILKNPEPFVRLSEHGDSSINFVVRVWVEKEDYWTVFFDMQEQVKEAFDSNGIEIPYPHMDVNVIGK